MATLLSIAIGFVFLYLVGTLLFISSSEDTNKNYQDKNTNTEYDYLDQMVTR